MIICKLRDKIINVPFSSGMLLDVIIIIYLSNAFIYLLFLKNE